MEQKPEPIALVDMDGTLCDYAGKLRHDLSTLRSAGEDERFESPQEQEDDPICLIKRRKLIKSIPGWWVSLPPLDDGMVIVDTLKDIGFDIHILTKGPATTSIAWKEKVEWCANWLPTAKVTITSDKGLVYGKILVDDWPPYITRWLEWRPRGLVIMPDRPWNNDYAHPNVRRFTSPEYTTGGSPRGMDCINNSQAIQELSIELRKLRADCI